jgi:hypothetical protein
VAPIVEEPFRINSANIFGCIWSDEEVHQTPGQVDGVVWTLDALDGLCQGLVCLSWKDTHSIGNCGLCGSPLVFDCQRFATLRSSCVLLARGIPGLTFLDSCDDSYWSTKGDDLWTRINL